MLARISQKRYCIRRIIATSAVLTALAASALFMLPGKTQYLILVNERSGKALYAAEASDGTEFSISFIHSVNFSPVTEHYQIIDGQIYLTALRYESFGAGMPTELTEGQKLSHEHGQLLITGFDRMIPRLCYFISRIDGHAFQINGVSAPLNTLDEPGEPVLFAVVERYVRPKLK